MTKQANRRFGKMLGVSAIALAAAMALGSPAFAQAGAGSIQGQVTGAAGQTVTFTDTVTGQRNTVAVGSDGRYVITGLRPSTYTVQVGSSEAQTVTLAVGQTVTVDFNASSADTIVVTAVRNREVRTATVNTNVTPFQIETLPTVSRNFLDAAALAPGVTVTNDFTTNNKHMQAGGVAPQNINVFIDGVSNKDQVGLNGVAGQSFSQGNPFPQSAIQEFQVQTQNFKAEYEDAGSAVITAVTKTGGAEFHGGAYAYYIPQDWFGQPYFQRNSPKPDFERRQYGINLGGPIVPDVLHFFIDYEATRSQYPSATINLTDPLVPSQYLAENGSATGQFDQDNYFAKLTWYASSADTVNVSYYKRSESDVRDFGEDGGISVRSHARNVGTQSETTTLDWTHRADNWLNSFSLSRFKNDTGTPTVTSGPEFNLLDGPTKILEAGAHFFTQANTETNTTFKEEFTWTGFDDHVIKAGIRYNRAELGREENNAANGRYYFSANDPSLFPDPDGLGLTAADYSAWAGFTDFQTAIPRYANISTRTPAPVSAKDNQYGLFIQDDWTIDDHWTVNYGLRWDYEDNAFNNKYVTPAAVATALRGYTNWVAAGINAEDYISNGHNRDPFKGEFQPRLGVSYDVNGDRNTVLFAGAGRYYDRNIFYEAALETIINSQTVPTVFFCGAAGQPSCSNPLVAASPDYIAWNEAYRDPAALRSAISANVSGDIWVLNNNAKVPYTDQFNIGLRQRFGDWQTSATLAYNHSQDAFIFVRGNRMPDGSYTSLGPAYIRDNFPAAGRPAGYTGRVDIGSSNGEAKYLALYLMAEKTYTEESGWGVTGTLTLSSARSNQAHNFADAEMFNAGEQDAYGWQDVVGLERWRFVGSGIYDLPWDFELSGVLTLSSGPAYGSIDFDGRDPPECPECIYFDDAGVNHPHGIAFKNLDMRLSKTFKLWGAQEFTVDGDVFNVFDSVNRNYTTWGGRENSTQGYARTYQIGVRYKW